MKKQGHVLVFYFCCLVFFFSWSQVALAGGLDLVSDTEEQNERHMTPFCLSNNNFE